MASDGSTIDTRRDTSGQRSRVQRRRASVVRCNARLGGAPSQLGKNGEPVNSDAMADVPQPYDVEIP